MAAVFEGDVGHSLPAVDDLLFLFGQFFEIAVSVDVVLGEGDGVFAEMVDDGAVGGEGDGQNDDFFLVG